MKTKLAENKVYLANPHCFKCSAYQSGYFACYTCNKFYCDLFYEDIETGNAPGEIGEIRRFHADEACRGMGDFTTSPDRPYVRIQRHIYKCGNCEAIEDKEIKNG